MKVEFFNTTAKTNKIGEFEITNDLTLRILEDKSKISIKLRNAKFNELGRILKIDKLKTIDKISFAGVDYTNLQYVQHEIYIHQPKDENVVGAITEDLNITFKKGELNV